MNREEYLEKALIEFEDYLSKAGYKLPLVKVSAGWPSSKAFSTKGRSLGECWHKDSIDQEASHVFISPYLSDTVEVLSVLVHELGHAILPKEVKHKKPFKQYMRDVDLTGKATQTEAGETLKSFIGLVIERIGTYPHTSIDKVPKEKKQTTRLKLWLCSGCNTKLRVAKDNLRVMCLDCDLPFIKDGNCKGDKE